MRGPSTFYACVRTTGGPVSGFLGGQPLIDIVFFENALNREFARKSPASKDQKPANSSTCASLITHAAATWNNGLDGSSGKDDGMGGAVRVDAGISIRATGIGWRRIGILFETTRRT